VKDRFENKLRSWEAVDADKNLEPGALSLVLYLGEKLYIDYEPNEFEPFMLRLENWLNNLPDENEQKILISLLSQLFYVGKNEFDSLYRSTLTNVSRWIADIAPIALEDPEFGSRLTSELRDTWFCPMTDSLRINSFLKINGLAGHDHRPHWRSLSIFGDVAKIKSYIKAKKIKRLVLLEDFVGSGSQISGTIRFICDNFKDIDVAFCPLIICPIGDAHFKTLASNYDRLSYLPTLTLPEEAFLTATPRAGEPPAFAKARSLFYKIGTRLPDPFGYKQTGALVVMFSNCPDNTLAVFREETATWRPLFPRVWRPE